MNSSCLLHDFFRSQPILSRHGRAKNMSLEIMSSKQNSVLVVDDEFSLRKVLRLSLAASGFAVEEARDGEEALGTVRGRPFDLVLLDINYARHERLRHLPKDSKNVSALRNRHG